MPEETENETASTRKRSQLNKELNTLGELIRILKPLDSAQRAKLIETANFMLKDG